MDLLPNLRLFQCHMFNHMDSYGLFLMARSSIPFLFPRIFPFTMCLTTWIYFFIAKSFFRILLTVFLDILEELTFIYHFFICPFSSFFKPMIVHFDIWFMLDLWGLVAVVNCSGKKHLWSHSSWAKWWDSFFHRVGSVIGVVWYELIEFPAPVVDLISILVQAFFTGEFPFFHHFLICLTHGPQVDRFDLTSRLVEYKIHSI